MGCKRQSSNPSEMTWALSTAWRCWVASRLGVPSTHGVPSMLGVGPTSTLYRRGPWREALRARAASAASGYSVTFRRHPLAAPGARAALSHPRTLFVRNGGCGGRMNTRRAVVTLARRRRHGHRRVLVEPRRGGLGDAIPQGSAFIHAALLAALES